MPWVMVEGNGSVTQVTVLRAPLLPRHGSRFAPLELKIATTQVATQLYVAWLASELYSEQSSEQPKTIYFGAMRALWNLICYQMFGLHL